MTEIEKATREVCEKLGICWHETVWKEKNYRTAGGKSIMDKCCVCVKCGERHAVNPDFSSEAGRVRLLKTISQRKDCDYFLLSATARMLINYLIDDSGSLLFAVRDWLAETKHPPMCASELVVEDGNY